MSDFRARIIAELDDRNIPSELKKIENKHTLVLRNFRIVPDQIRSQIQAALNGSRLAINVGGINMSNIENQVRSSANRAGQSYSQALLDRINSQISNGGIEASISRVQSSYEKLGSTGHSRLSQISKDIERLNTLQNSMVGNTTDMPRLVADYREYNDVLIRTRNNLSVVRSETSQLASLQQMRHLDGQMELWLKNNPRAASEYGDTINALRKELSDLYAQGKLTTSENKRIADSFKNIDTQARLAGKSGRTLGDTLGKAFKSLFRYVSISYALMYARMALRQMYNNVVNINAAMVELKKVTNETDASYNKFLDNAGAKAKKLGTTIANYVSSTADFARLGFDLDEADRLSEVANIYAVVGDDIDSIDTATQSIISTLTAFDVKVEDSMSIVDKFNEVANNFAISAGGIGDALQRSASALASSNNTLDESIAMITAAHTVVQDADVVGGHNKCADFKNSYIGQHPEMGKTEQRLISILFQASIRKGAFIIFT